MLHWKKYLVFLLMALSISFCAQNEASQWYFGIYAGLDFLTNPPTILVNGALYPTPPAPIGEGCAAISNSAGAILFYTNGETIWNQNHTPMANGTGLFGNISSCQAAIIVKQPSNTNLYYVFTPSGNGTGSLYYSIVDMSLSSGTGSVVIKNMPLMPNTTERITATRHCNGVDYWIIGRDMSTNFCSYLLTATGISTTAIVSSVCCNPSTWAGEMKISPNGNKLCLADDNSGLIMHEFDNSTGAVTAPYQLSNQRFYGCDFSPDGTKVYAAGTAANKVMQWDLCAGSNSTAIIASSYTLSFNGGYSVQQAPNGKIYIVRGAQNLCVINNPNNYGSACNFVALGQSIAPKSNGAGLPNFPGSMFQIKGDLPFTYTASNSLGCQAAAFTPSFHTNCSAYGSPANSYLWNFGDPLSGSNNTSSLSNPTHTFSSLGTYTVSLVRYYPCGTPDTVRQSVVINQSCISVMSNSITCANLGTATVFPTAGVGPFSYTWYPSLQSGSVATGLNPGTHTVSVFDAGNSFSYTGTVTFVSNIPLTGTILSTSSVSCNGAFTGTAIVSNLAGGYGNQTYLWTNGVNSYSSSFVNSLSAGIWSVNVTDALTGCQINQSFFISQPPALVLNLSANTPTACASGSIALTATNSGGTPGYTYTWTNAPPSATAAVSETLAGNYIYTLNSLDANNCLATNTIGVNFIANPTITVADVSVCPLAFGTLSASGASTYSFYSSTASTPTSTPLSVTVGSFTDSPAVTSEYVIIGSALGCTAAATASIILYPSPIPVIQTNSPRCEGTNMYLNASGVSGYQWTGPNVFSSNTATNNFSFLSLNEAGVYNLTVTSVNGCTASTSATLAVNPIPTVSAAGSTVCTTQSITLFANSSAPNFNWFGPMNFSSNQQNPIIANPVLNRTGTYTVVATSAQACTNSAVAQVLVVSPPSLSLALSSKSLCAQAFNGSPNTITLSSSGANTYTLFTPNLIGVNFPYNPTNSFSVSPPYTSSVTIGTATLQGSNGICSAFSTFIFTVIPNPTVGVNSFTPVICAGQNFTYTSNGADSYVWSATTPNYTTYSNGGVAVAHPSINAVFSVFGASLGCNSALVTSSITVYALPSISLSAASASICLHNSTTLKSSGTGTSFQWLPNTGLNQTNSASVTANPLATQVYTLIATANNCTNTADILLTVLPLPIPNIFNPKDKVCLGDSIHLSGTGGLIYNWMGPDNFSVMGKDVAFLALHQGFNGQYTLTVTDENACKNITSTAITVLPLPSGSLVDFKEDVCVPYCTTYQFSGLNNNVIQSTWKINGTNFNANKFYKCFSSAGTYTFEGSMKDAQSGCKAQLSYVLTVHEKPKADFNYSPLHPIQEIDELQFVNTSQGNELTKFNWFFNDNKGFTSKNKNTNYLYSEPGEYPVVLIAENIWSCRDTILKIIKVESDFAIYVPNSFTPNDDNRNDVFMPVVHSATHFDFKIYDRWGKEIFHSKSPEDGWDGSFTGELCKQDVYTWVIELTTNQGEHLQKTGAVTLIR